MKILYGIQGTGNGHISRGRMMAKSFASYNDISVDFLFSGREAGKFHDMDIFGNYIVRRGLTFHSENGKVSHLKTIAHNNIFQFFSEVKSLQLDNYDLVITDFEPVTAWAGKLQGKTVIGIGHQYAFDFPVPRAGSNPVANLIMRFFAPAHESIGLHWDRFNSPILPPIIDPSIIKTAVREERSRKKIVVYLPFETQQNVVALLDEFPEVDFFVYSADLSNEEHGHIHLRKTSFIHFKKDLATADAVICNSGFELISECLHLGLAILSKPMQGQMEQLSNAEALTRLGYARIMDKLEKDKIASWLNQLPCRAPLNYPDVAKALVDWVASGRQESPQTLSDRLWVDVAIS